MSQYLSPGVYVQEVPSAVKAIAGVSTSTPGFIGIVPDKVHLVAKDPDHPPDPEDPGKVFTKYVDFPVALGPKTPQLITNFTQLDRKSTRLNSSHLVISYAVFCLKKKK